MFAHTNFKSFRAARGYTLIELLAVIFIICGGMFVGNVATHYFGKWPGIAAGIGGGLLCMGIVVLFYRWSWHRQKMRLKMLREQYRMIYRVLTVATDAKSIIKPPGAEIRIGDYGWEALPIRTDGLIYLQGLTEKWGVVWHAGFQPEQIEQIGLKPASQYDYWVPYWVKAVPPACPFPVQKRTTQDMGLPHHSNKYFSQPMVRQ